MSTAVNAHTRDTVVLPFNSVRNGSSPEDTENNRRVYIGQTPITSIIGLSTEANVRDYLVEAEGKKIRRETQVHRAIKDTLKKNPGDFSVLNSGVVIVARSCEVNEKEKTLVLNRPSIINGSQTQGVIKDFLAEMKEAGVTVPLIHMKFEVIVTTDEELIAEISIARNFQNDVMTLSIAGRLGQLDDLEKAVQAKKPKAKLQTSETKLSDDYIKTERLLQLISALIPEELWHKGKDFNKVYTYSMKAKCLKDFREIHDKAKDPKHPEYAVAREAYQFYLDIAADALDMYDTWKAHQGFQGTGLHAIEREGRKIVDIPDGIIFPIIAAHSAFAVKTSSGWKIKPPKVFDEKELINMAKTVYQTIANRNPWIMGKSPACYSALYQITSLYKRLSAAA